MNYSKCPTCQQSVGLYKLYLSTPLRTFDCKNCKTTLCVENKISTRLTFYSILPFVLLAFAYWLVDMTLFSAMPLLLVMLLWMFFGVYSVRITLGKDLSNAVKDHIN